MPNQDHVHPSGCPSVAVWAARDTPADGVQGLSDDRIKEFVKGSPLALGLTWRLTRVNAQINTNFSARARHVQDASSPTPCCHEQRSLKSQPATRKPERAW